MTIRASARCSDLSCTSTPIGVDGFYSASFELSVIDDSGGQSPHTGIVAAPVPYSLSQKKADGFIRQFLADTIHDGYESFPATGLTIDPDDIYIPFSGR